MNEPVSPKGVLRLCRAGVLPASDFLRAAALCRCDRKWVKFILLILRFMTGLSFLAAAFLSWFQMGLFLSTRRFCSFGRFVRFMRLYPRPVCRCGLCRRRFDRPDDFLPGIVFRTNSFLYEEFFLWFALLAVWAVPSRRAGTQLSAFVVLNAAICLYGVQFALPSFIVGATTFFILAAAFNLLCLAAREYLPFRPELWNRSCFGFFRWQE